MFSSHSTRRFTAVALSACVLFVAVPAGGSAIASSPSASVPAPQAQVAIRSKKYCDRLYKQLRKTNSPKVAKFLAQLRGCVFKTKKRR